MSGWVVPSALTACPSSVVVQPRPAVRVTVIWTLLWSKMLYSFLRFMWPCIVTNLFMTKQLNALISKIYFGRKVYIFRTVPVSIIRSFSLYTQQWYMSYSFADSLQAGSGCSILILLASCQQTCMKYTIAVFTVKKSLIWTEELSEKCSFLPK